MIGLFLLPFTLAVFQASSVAYTQGVRVQENQMNGSITASYNLNEETQYKFSFTNNYTYIADWDFNSTKPTYMAFYDEYYPLNMLYSGGQRVWSIDTTEINNPVATNRFTLQRNPTDSDYVRFDMSSFTYDEHDIFGTNYICHFDTTLLFDSSNHGELYRIRIMWDYDNFFNPSYPNQTYTGEYLTRIGGTTGCACGVNFNLANLQSFGTIRFYAIVSITYEVMPFTFNQFEQYNGFITDNYNNGYNVGLLDGQDQGYQSGYEGGYEYGLEDGLNQGYQQGYSAGYQEAENVDATTLTIFNGILSVGILPVQVFMAILNWEVFGINIGSFVSATLSILMLVILFRFIFKSKVSD